MKYILIILLFYINDIYSQKQLYAGISKVSIIPENKLLFGNKKINDTLYAKTLIIDNLEEKVAFIIIDSQGIAQYIVDEIKKNINLKTNFPTQNIVVATTHTHSGIISNTSPENFNNSKLNEYQLFLIKTITNGFISAYTNLIPSKIAWANFDKSEYVFNRRWYTKKLNMNPYGIMDSIIMNPGSSLRKQLIKPAGPIDPQISFIALQTTSNVPLAILANYSLHYVGGVEKDVISADYFGFFDTNLNKLLHENKINPNFLGLMTNGTSGDINNHDYSKVLPSYKSYERMMNISQDIAESIITKYNQLDFKNWVQIQILTENITLEKRRLDEQIKNNLEKISANYSDEHIFHKSEKYYFNRLDYYEKNYPKTFDVTLQVIQLGDLTINTIPFEVFAETGLELKKKSSFDHSFTIGLANGHWGYLPTPKQHQKGGYETWITVSRVEKNSSELITKQILEMQKEIKKK